MASEDFSFGLDEKTWNTSSSQRTGQKHENSEAFFPSCLQLETKEAPL